MTKACPPRLQHSGGERAAADFVIAAVSSGCRDCGRFKREFLTGLFYFDPHRLVRWVEGSSDKAGNAVQVQACDPLAEMDVDLLGTLHVLLDGPADWVGHVAAVTA